MHTSYTNHKQTLINYLLQYYFCLLHLVRSLLGCHFFRSEWGTEYNGLLTCDFSFCLGGEKEN